MNASFHNDGKMLKLCQCMCTLVLYQLLHELNMIELWLVASRKPEI